MTDEQEGPRQSGKENAPKGSVLMFAFSLVPRASGEGPGPGPDSHVTDEDGGACPPLPTFKMPVAEVGVETQTDAPCLQWAA